MNLFKRAKPTAAASDPRQRGGALAGGRRPGESVNPYLNARRTWNDHVGSIIAQRQTWQVIGLMALLIALAAVGGAIYIGSQSKFIPYVVQVDKLGQTIAAGPVSEATRADPRVVHAALADWLTCARTVSPDVAYQRKCVFKVYSMLAPNDPATATMNEYLNGNVDASPFKRAENEMVSVDIKSVLQQTPETWQIEWVETIRDRQGAMKAPGAPYRAIITTSLVDPTPNTSEDQLRNNPLGIYVRSFSWQKVL